MNKLLTTSLLIAGLSGASHAAGLDDAFKKGTTSGQLRLGYISVSPDATGSETTTGGAMGGEIKFETAKWNRFQLALAPYFVEKVDALTGDDTKINGDFFDGNNESYAYLGEAYVNYAFKNGSFRYGRQKLDTPFINTDDIRMFSNTFTAAWLNMAMSKSLTLDLGQVSTWAGFDSGSSQEKFKRASNDGVSAFGLNYKASDDFSAQAWYYSFDKAFSLIYADATYSTGNLEIGVQMGSYSESDASGVDGSVLGASITYSAGPFTLAAVMNSGTNDDGKSASLGLGGGNYYAAMDESTIDGLNDAEAQVISIEYAATDKFTAAVAVGHFEDNGAATEIDETNVVLSYSASDSLDVELIHTTVDALGTADDFSRQTLRATYSF
ncbi:MAG: OprD family outer membrane porin [Gammaproteobacteria bacterium]|nr:OprD family outer membrane porin [Gammaproteobacteria bacterium]